MNTQPDAYIPNSHLIRVRFLGPTDTRGSRVKLTSMYFGKSVTIPFSYTYSSSHETAVEWLRANGCTVSHRCSAGADDFVVIGEFAESPFCTNRKDA